MTNAAELTARPSRASTVVGVRPALALALRNSRWFWLVWVLLLWAVIPTTAAAYRTTIPDDAAGALEAAALAGNATMRAILGPPYDLLHVGSFTMFRVGSFVATLAAIMAVLGVIRATRAEEETGRAELLRAGVSGRHTQLLAATILGLSCCGALALLIAASMAPTSPAAGALCMGLGIGLTGAVFVGFGAVAAQLTASARTARSLALGAVGVAYLLRAVADGSPNASALHGLQWVSPVEWAALARPYVGERWWVLLLPVVLTLALLAAAFGLESRRDYGAGIRPARPGPAVAAPGLSGAGGLAWRLQRGNVTTWGIGVAIYSLAVGSLVDFFETAAQNPALAERFRRMGGGSSDPRKAFYVAMLGIAVVGVAVFAVQLLDRLHREEDSGRSSAMLATATSRLHYAASYLIPALVMPTALLALAGALTALPSSLAGGKIAQVAQIAGAAIALAPGLWVIVGVAMVLHGWAPRLLIIPWIVVGWSMVANWVGPVIGLPEALLKFTPFAALPHLPAEQMSFTAVLVETAIAVGLVAVGLTGYRRRNLG